MNKQIKLKDKKFNKIDDRLNKLENKHISLKRKVYKDSDLISHTQNEIKYLNVAVSFLLIFVVLEVLVSTTRWIIYFTK